MAELTDRLGLTQGTNRVIADPAMPSGIGAAFDFAKDALAGYSNLKSDMARNKAEKRVADEKAREAQIAFQVTGLPTAARNDVATQNAANIREAEAQIPAITQTAPLDYTIEAGVFSEQAVTISPAADKTVQREMQAMKNVAVAVEQGRLPQISLNSAISSRFAALREQFPMDTEYLLDMAKKAGIDPSLYTEMKDAQNEHAFEREQRQKSVDDARAREEAAIATAEGSLGPDGLTMTREQKIIHGLTLMKSDSELKTLAAQTDIKLKQAGLTKEGADAVKADTNEQIFQSVNNEIYNQAVPIISTIQNLGNAMMKDPNNAQNIQAWQEHGVRVRQLIPQIAENALQRAVANGYTGDADAFKKRITDIYGPLNDLFTGDGSVVMASVNALRAIETSAKIDTAKALPFMTALTKAGIKVTEMPGFLKAIDGNPDLQQRLSDEIKGYVTDWGKDRASTHLMSAIKIMRGEHTLAYMPPAEARTMIPTLVNVNRALSKDYVAGKDVDGDKVLNTAGEVLVAARSLTPSSGATVLYVATQGFANASTRNALVKTLTDPSVENKDVALATVQASRAASAHTLNSVRLAVGQANKASPYFKAEWDERNGRYQIVKTPAFAELRKRGGMTGAYTAKYGNAVTPAMQEAADKMQPPDVLRRLVDAGNLNLENAIALGRHDPSTPIASEIQLRNWYGQERALPPEPGRKDIDPTKEVGKQLDILDDVLDEGFSKALTPVAPMTGERRATNLAGKEIVVPPIENIRSRFSDNKNFQEITTQARSMGIPEDVAIRLGWVESGGSFKDNLNPNGAGAMGPIQTVPKYQNPLAQELFGKNVPELTPAQMITVGLTYLKRNYTQHGNWADAVSQYHSGGPLSRRRKSKDSNIMTSEYVKLITD